MRWHLVLNKAIYIYTSNRSIVVHYHIMGTFSISEEYGYLQLNLLCMATCTHCFVDASTFFFFFKENCSSFSPLAATLVFFLRVIE